MENNHPQSGKKGPCCEKCWNSPNASSLAKKKQAVCGIPCDCHWVQENPNGCQIGCDCRNEMTNGPIECLLSKCTKGCHSPVSPSREECNCGCHTSESSDENMRRNGCDICYQYGGHPISQEKLPSPSQEELSFCTVVGEGPKMPLVSATEDTVVVRKEELVKYSAAIRSQARASTLKEVGEAIQEVSGEIYPEDIFPPPPKGWEKKLDEWCKSQGYRIDNISGWYARWARANLKRDILALLQEKGDSKGGI